MERVKDFLYMYWMHMVLIVVVFLLAGAIKACSESQVAETQTGVELQVIDKFVENTNLRARDRLTPIVSYILSVKVTDTYGYYVPCTGEQYENIDVGDSCFFTILYGYDGEILDIALE